MRRCRIEPAKGEGRALGAERGAARRAHAGRPRAGRVLWSSPSPRARGERVGVRGPAPVYFPPPPDLLTSAQCASVFSSESESSFHAATACVVGAVSDPSTRA